MDEATRKRNSILGVIAGIVLLGVALGIVGLLFFGKPLGFQYANAQTQLERVTRERDELTKSTTAYFSALEEGKPAEAAKAQMSSDVQALVSSMQKLESEPAVARDEAVQKAFISYKQTTEKLLQQTKDVVKTVDLTADLRKTCNQQVFDQLDKAVSREAGWKAFEPCAAMAGSFDPSTIPDPDYQLLFTSMKKAFADTRRYLTEDESLYDQAMLGLASYAMSTQLTDTTVRERLRETASLVNAEQLAVRLKQKHAS